MTADLDDDEELTFDAEAQAEPEKVQAPEPRPESEAPEAQPQAQAQAQPEAPAPAPSQDEANAADVTAEAKPRRSKTGMLVAAGFAVCILASVTSAVMAWRAASLVAEANENASGKKLAAKLDYLQRLAEQQRDTLDGLSAKPGPATAAASGGDGQLNALAAAVRANQEMNERLPAIIMRQVDGRLAGARAVPKPAAAAKAKFAKVAKAKPRPVVKTAVASKPIAPLPLQPIDAPAAPKRPAGEAIRYP